MAGHIKNMAHSFVTRIIVTVGVTLLITISLWAFFNIHFQHQRETETVVSAADKLATTIRLGTRYAMMLNARSDINQIIQDIGKQKDLKEIRIYNKEGVIKFSKNVSEVNQPTNIRAEACDACHQFDPPLSVLNLNRRARLIKSNDAYRQLGVISPIYNEPGCSSATCHFHPAEQSILGALDVVMSLETIDADIQAFKWRALSLAVAAFFVTAIIILLLVLKFIRQPIRKLIAGTEHLTAGNYEARVDLRQNDELGLLADSINRMGKTIGEKEAALNKQRNDYQRLFEMVPCTITVQDRDYRLISYNRQFAEKFNPMPGDYCYCAYKGRSEKCEKCPVEQTFQDGRSHYSQETAFQKDGTARHWIVRTSPIKDDRGDIVAAMEMSLDITHRKLLQDALEESEKKYYAIFNNIPNPIFVLTIDTLIIVDCNDSVTSVYGYEKSEILQRCFLDLFHEGEREQRRIEMKTATSIDRVQQVDKAGNNRFFNIRISPSDYPGKKVLLVTTGDITQRLETEQQLIHSSKMATLGEMATGVAHELNQPLSVIKTASSFFMKKIKKKEPIPEAILQTLAEEIDSHVDRATKIINHMRQFGRKSEGETEPIDLNVILRRAFEIFRQQLKLRGIAVGWEITEGLPEILGDAGRLEQVFINLLINARDAIEEKVEARIDPDVDKKIILRTQRLGEKVCVDVQDSGVGIDDSIAERIFEPFFTTKKVGKGTGLGLSISYGIVKDCGGNIDVVPCDDGACFRLTFPVATRAENGEWG